MKKFFLTLLALLVLTSGNIVSAQQYEADGLYFMGSKDTREKARDGALQDAKRLALEQAGSFLVSFTQTLNGELSVDKVTSIAAGVIKLEAVLSEGAQAVDGAITYAVKARFIVNSADLQKKIADLQQSGKLEETIQSLANVQKRYEILLAENNQLKQQIAQTTDAEARKNLAGQIETTANMLTATQWFEKGLDATDTEAELDAYNKAIALDPNYVYAYNNRGVIYSERGQYDLAIADYSQAILLSPVYERAYNNRGAAYDLKGQHDVAIADYTQAIALNPQYASAYYNRGLAYADKQQYDSAFADLNKTIDLDPANSSAYNNRGNVYALKGKADLAMADYNKALALDPKNLSAYNNRAIAYTQTGQYNLSIDDYTQAIAIDPGNTTFHTYRGLVYIQIKLYDLALADFEQALKLDTQYELAQKGRDYVLQLMQIK